MCKQKEKIEIITKKWESLGAVKKEYMWSYKGINFFYSHYSVANKVKDYEEADERFLRIIEDSSAEVSSLVVTGETI